MHPHWHWHRPSRFFWFVIGAASAGVFFRGHELRNQHFNKVCWHEHAHQAPAYAAPEPSSALAAPAPANTNAVQSPDSPHERRSGHWAWRWPREESGGAAPAPAPAGAERWEDERQRMHDMRKQATDTIADVSENTLETLLATMQGLKARLAENRVQRERELQEMQAMRTEQHKQFEEWLRQQEQNKELHRVV